ncbi:trans-Golgi network-localized SYP41-interacting protein 1-like isoform X1 [Actinidia eriantha]|uniref:trans-Golgi network-localized SYP41-interacting protein 1-like isoform X1 n=1 Tax=Actinidia eriantha TaxID=165200 RepID=UPI002586FD91|nr:trans-Golgi network-localized SYP41-interacting protein 1-like isoform X1 [Actinidia eriantha]XP_057508983.1 trans-Golgi network-localized SYP41-interacting protein 1-like isoform X1 [Actinidia eriantha]XP_057508984.1 trans-Golgi network-localized SYP41-interacting protein 1-like isoform X1 [Actinidia eriantha]
MFVDCPDELIVSDDREALPIPEIQQRSEDKDDVQDIRVHELNNGAQAHDLTDELVHLRAMLEKTIDEREYKEERNAFMNELANLHHQLKSLSGHKSLLSENSGGLADGFHEESMEELGDNISLSDKPLHNIMHECSKFAMNALEQWSQKEETFREFHAMKGQEIEDLQAKVQGEQQYLEAITNRVLASLAMAVNEEELLNDSISGKMSHVEKNTYLLIEKYNYFLYETDLLRQCLTEVRSDFRIQDNLGTTFVAARDALLEFKRNEVDLAQKISNLEDENMKLVEQIDRGKEMMEMANSDVEKLRVELEHEKTKFANTKEKLSLAVTKGKALVQQRDSLKQSLAEKTSELEICLTELQEKSTALEAADISKEELIRTENLSASLQEALSQRNSILAQCEDILSQTTAAQELQSEDTIERVRWLVDERNTLYTVKLELDKLTDALSWVDLPENVSPSDLEYRVNWLVESLSQAKGEAYKLQDEIARTSEVANSEIEHLTTSLIAETQAKHCLQEELEDLTHKYEESVEKEHQASSEKGQIVSMLLEASGLPVEADQPPTDVAMLMDRCFGKAKERSCASFEPSGLEVESYERIQTLLYIKDQELILCEKLLEEDTLVKSKVNTLLADLGTASQELKSVKDEKSTLQKDLERSEEKSALLREKLSMAVKKGKGLVKERENLRKLVDEKTEEIEKLKLEVQQQESALDDCKDQITKLSADVELVPKLEADLSTATDRKDQLERFMVESNNMLQRVIESIDSIVLPIDSTFEEPVEKVQWIAGYINECQVVKMDVAQELDNLKLESTSLSSKLAEAYTAKKSLEEALSMAENNISLLAEEKRELEVGKTYVEQELQKALKEASSQAGKFLEVCTTTKSLEDALSEAENKISVLMNEKEDAQLCRTASEMELEKVREEASIQTTALAEAYRTIKSLEDALSCLQMNVSVLSEENNNVQFGRTNLENEMKKLKEEADTQSIKLADAFSTIKSLEDALLKAENNISELVDEKKKAEEDISALNSKLNACMDELAGTTGCLESRSLELSSHLNNLQLLLKDQTVLSVLARSFKIKFESLKDMDLLLKDIKDHFVEMESETLQRYPVTEEDSFMSKISDGLDNIENVEMDNGEGNGLESSFRKTMEVFHFRNKILEGKVEAFSTSMDDFIAALLKKLQATRDDLVLKLEHMKSLKEKVNSLEMGRQAQKDKITMLENEIRVLLSACTGATQELEVEVENYPVELRSAPELEELNLFSEVRETSGDAVAEHQLRLDTSEHVNTAKNLLLAAKKVGALAKQLENVRNESADEIKDLKDELTENRTTLANAIEEKDQYQNRLSKLESELEALQDSYQEMRFKIQDYQAKEDKLNDREAEILSFHNALLMKEKDAEDAFLSASQVKSLYEKINDIEVPFAEFKVGDTEFNDSDHAKKLFYIIDAYASMQRQINLLSDDKEELQSTLVKQVHQIEHLKEEVEEQIKDKQYYEKMKNELVELELGLDNIIQKLGGNDLVGDQKKSAGVRGLITVLEKLVMAVIFESENSKSKAQELGSKFLGSENFVDELSTRVKLLEDSNHGRCSSPPEAAHETSIEAPSLPTRSEITEMEDVGPLAKKVVAPVPSAAHVRTLRKGSNDHLAINIDSESDHLIENEETDEDKGHIFKSLNTSGIIPIQGKMIADRIDGIWVSGGRALMSRPRGRLGLIAYWLFLHLWLLGTIL